LIVTLKSYYRKRPNSIREAEDRGIPVYVLRSNSIEHIEQFLAELYHKEEATDPISKALSETQSAIRRVVEDQQPVELSPQTAYIRKLQHQMVERYGLNTRSTGREPYRRVEIHPTG